VTAGISSDGAGVGSRKVWLNCCLLIVPVRLPHEADVRESLMEVCVQLYLNRYPDLHFGVYLGLYLRL
jgi:hypothetical protein